MSFEARLAPLGDTALVISLGEKIDIETHEKVRAVTHLLDSSPPEAMIEYIPAFTTVTVIYDPLTASVDRFEDDLRALLESASHPDPGVGHRLEVIPVCYGDDFGPDLDFVSSHAQISRDEVISLHGKPEYVVYMIGFAPGFPYLGGMSERIASPRRDSPRDAIPAGSVGIAGNQTGLYPIETPGGWQLIGRTPLTLFRPTDSHPSLLETGDHVRFQAIGLAEYEEIFEREHRR